MAFATLTVSALTGAAEGGCSSPDVPRYPLTPVDCVAVLGAPPPSPQMLRGRLPDGVPYSGIDRSKLIGQLTDEELGRFCDYGNCLLLNGYLRSLYSNGQTGFVEEGLPLAAQWMDTVVAVDPSGRALEAGDSERKSCVELNREYFAQCPVGPYEDCNRERSVVPFGLVEYRPSCSVFLTCRTIQ